MIQATELRVGNLVMTNNSKYRTNDVGKIACVVSIDSENNFEDKKGTATVYLIDDKYKDTHGQWLHFYEPIPITEEWLFKFGFVDGHKCEEYHNFIILDPFFIVAYKKNNYHLHVYGKFNIEIKYIHQLQNLYFALTGKELELLNLNQ